MKPTKSVGNHETTLLLDEVKRIFNWHLKVKESIFVHISDGKASDIKKISFLKVIKRNLGFL